MDFNWCKHRFSGGVLVLDLVNTVVHRNNPAMYLDRLNEPARFAGFAGAASKFRHIETGTNRIISPDDKKDQQKLLKLREAANTVFRSNFHHPLEDKSSATNLQKLFSAAAQASRHEQKDHGMISLGLACSMSAMRLLGNSDANQIRACPNCDWLFLDKSKNGSRRWCDMAVCGNRAKAEKHYRGRVTGSRI